MDNIKTKEQVRQYAINYQRRMGDESVSYGEIIKDQNKLIKLAKQFNLTREFKENGII